MLFALQLGHPKINQKPFPVFERLRDGIAALFRADEESVYLFWHTIPLRLRYREDLARAFDDILAMAWLLQRDDRGATRVTFETQIVSITWVLRWEAAALVVTSEFTALEPLYAPYTEALSRFPELQIDRHAFLSEWKTLLRQLVIAVETGAVVIRDGTERRKWEMLQRVESAIPRYGSLYLQLEQP